MSTIDFNGKLTDTDSSSRVVSFPVDATKSCAEKFHHRGSYTTTQADAAINFGSVASASVLVIHPTGTITNAPTFKLNSSTTAHTIESGGYLFIFDGAATALTFSWTANSDTLVLEVFGAGA